MQFFPKFFLLHVSMGETHRGQSGGSECADAVKAGVLQRGGSKGAKYKGLV